MSKKVAKKAAPKKVAKKVAKKAAPKKQAAKKAAVKKWARLPVELNGLKINFILYELKTFLNKHLLLHLNILLSSLINSRPAKTSRFNLSNFI